MKPQMHTGTYTVVGRSAVHGHEPGETFILTAPYEQIGALVVSGHLAVAEVEES